MTFATPVTSAPSVRRDLLWLLAGALAAGVLSTTASQVPPEFRKLVLLYAIFGAACGFVLAWLAKELHPRAGWFRFATAAILTMAGAAALGWLSYRQFHKIRHTHEGAASLKMIRGVLEATNDPKDMENFEEHRRLYDPLFSDYLAYRVSDLGKWPAPLPTLFWISEIALAGVLAGVIVRRSSSGTQPSPPAATQHT